MRLKILGLLVALTAGAALVAAVAVQAGEGKKNDGGFEYAIGLWGDLPYNDVQAQVGVPNLISDMNDQDLAFTVHDGDLKAGNAVSGSVTPTSCANALYRQGLDYLNQLKEPAMFTPGDNDWTDCDRPSNGGFNSLERLDYERGLFFATDKSLGKDKLKQKVQTDALCLGYVSGPAAGPTVTKQVPCVENRIWTVKKVTYVTVNVQGSCNNLCDTFPNPAEYAARNAADIAWLKAAFTEAADKSSAGVMVIGQADPGFDGSDATRAPTRDPKTLAESDANSGPLDGYQAFLVELRKQTIAFAKPVVYVHGDSHYFRVDKPFLDAQGRRLENFTRVETFGDNQGNGDNDVHWIKVTVDPRSRDVFSYQPQIVPGNRTAVPAP
jgi:hypothetical protein